MKCAGFIAAVGARHPRGPVYTWLPVSGSVLVKPSLEFAEAILAERGLWKETLRDQGKGGGGGATGHRNVSSMTGQNRNVRLCSLLGTLINLGYEGDALREALIAANAEYDDPLGMDEMEDTILKPKPNFVRHPGADGADGLEVPESAHRHHDPLAAQGSGGGQHRAMASSFRGARGCRVLDGLDDVEAVEFGVPEEGRFARSGGVMGGAKLIRSRPGQEILPRGPHCVRGKST